ncbi:peroxidase-related enzyme [Caldimonas tepidiphila]|uniref:peroxidase-related enzyme n=1 Tax=Caldimonas tepidiphila TaxID=2315841 RepID=UPI000E5B922E|nr:peroxidase-related enzyme [Caldimonas tepidiphila]
METPKAGDAAQRPLARFPLPALQDLPADIRERILAVQEKSGFVPNVFLLLARRPDEFRAFFAYHHALMEKEGGLTKAEREMIVVATSAANGCLYCVVAHGAILRIRAKNPRLADQLATNLRRAEITPRQRAMLDFALKLAQRPAEVDEAELAALRAQGFGDEEIWDIGAITAFFAMSNRLANLTGLAPNEEFYLLGRLPKA